MTVVIFAPHVDDEAIGLYTLLTSPTASEFVVAYFDVNDERRNEALHASKAFGFDAVFPLGRSPSVYVDEMVSTGRICWAPDPHWEIHPLHKMVGVLVHEACARKGIRFGTYSTNMNVPYLRELPPVKQREKQMALDGCYPSQAGLWRSDHRYFLFEGRVEWNGPV